MPRYEYKCKKCDESFEAVHGVDENVDECRFCGEDVRRVFHPVGIVFKGPGFYVTDSRDADKTHHAPPKPEEKKEEKPKADKKKDKSGESVKTTS